MTHRHKQGFFFSLTYFKWVSVFLQQEERNVALDVFYAGALVVAHVGLPVLGDEKLLPVPADVAVPEGTVEQIVRVREALASRGTICLLIKREISVVN